MINLKKEEIKKESTLEEEFKEHMKFMQGSVCYGCAGCKFICICPNYEMSH